LKRILPPIFGQRRQANRPRLRTLGADEAERHASWLELFFDLVFVLAVSQVARILMVQTDLVGFVKYVVLFIPVWYVWVGYTFYTDRFETEEITYRILMFAGMLAVIGMSITLGGAFSAAGDGAFVVCLALVRLFLVALFSRAAYYVPLARPYCQQFIIGLSGSALLILGSMFFAPPVRYAIWGVAQLMEFAIPFLNLRATQLIPIDRSHIPERFGLFTIIVLGEVVMSTATGASTVEWNWASVTIASLGFGMAAGIWWINFDFVEDGAIRSGALIPRFIYLYGHFFIVASIVAAGVGVEHAIKESSEPHLHLPTLLLIGGGMAVYLGAVTIVRMITGVCNLVFIRLAAILLTLATVAVGGYFSPVVIISVLFLLMVTAIWIETRFDVMTHAPDAPLHQNPCEHAEEAIVFEPRLGTLECEECVKNNYKWVHLRLCMSCGHVGCCDSSKYTHATKHFHATAHPIMSSLEELENWAWCYEDERFVPMPSQDRALRAGS
jgi:low temperature requirement protein LtrA